MQQDFDDYRALMENSHQISNKYTTIKDTTVRDLTVRDRDYTPTRLREPDSPNNPILVQQVQEKESEYNHSSVMEQSHVKFPALNVKPIIP